MFGLFLIGAAAILTSGSSSSSSSKAKAKTTTSRTVLGYDRIFLHRPKFIYFEYTGLRPSAPHWIFFDGKEVTRFVNTSYTKSDYVDAARDSILKEPGEKFVSATEFPTDAALPYSGATAQGGASDPLFASANGIISGVFYLQSNSDVKFRMNRFGTKLAALDVLQYRGYYNNAYSFASAKFKGMAQYENYWNAPKPKANPKPASYYYAMSKPAKDDGGSSSPSPLVSVRVGNTWHNAYTTSQVKSLKDKAAGGTIVGGSSVSSSSIGKTYGGGGGK